MSGADAYSEALRLDALGRYAEAQKLCQQILKAAPKHPDVHHLAGVVYFHAGQYDDAIRHLKEAMKLKPDFTDAAGNLAKAYYRKAKWRELIHLLAAKPATADTLTQIGFAEEQLGDIDAAMATYRRALDVNPDAAEAHNNIGAILTRRGDVAAAQTHLDRALAAAAPPATALLNLAMLHEGAGRADEAAATYARILQNDPDNALVHFQRAMTLLSQGHFTEGWQEYHWRFRRPGTRTLHAVFTMPFWNGEPLKGRKLLVWTEQGPGDEILLASMIPDVIALGAELTLACSPRLVPLFRRSFPTARIVSNEKLQQVGAHDFQASFSHLGAALRADFNAFPRAGAFLRAEDSKRTALRSTYQSGDPARRLIGIAWHSANPIAEAQKSTALQDWAPILKTPDVTFVNLQYGDHSAKAAATEAAFGCKIITDKAINPLKDIDGFAAQVAAMDHVVSVSNTTVHVAGGLGVPTSVLVPKVFGKIWYWFLERADSPWYSALTLHRQTQAGDWSDVVAATAHQIGQPS